MMLSDVCLSDVCRVHPVSGRRVRPAGCIASIGWLKAAAVRFRCKAWSGHIVAADRLQLVKFAANLTQSFLALPNSLT